MLRAVEQSLFQLIVCRISRTGPHICALILSLQDGHALQERRLILLKRHRKTHYDLSPEQYREKCQRRSGIGGCAYGQRSKGRQQTGMEAA